MLETRAPRPVEPEQRRAGASTGAAGRRPRRASALGGLISSGSSRGSLIDRSRAGFGVTPAWSSTIAPAPSVLRIVSRATPCACSCATTSMKSCAVSSSTRRLPISGSSLSSWMRCWSRVEAATSTRAACQLFAPRANVGAAVSARSVSSGTRRAASSPAIQRLRSSPRAFVLKLPP